MYEYEYDEDDPYIEQLAAESEEELRGIVSGEIFCSPETRAKAIAYFAGSLSRQDRVRVDLADSVTA